MKYLQLIVLAFLSVLLFSCEEDVKDKQAEVLKAQRYNDSIVKIISNNWKFNVPAPGAKAQQHIAGWNEWQQFKNELAQKPAGSIDAFRQKSKSIAEKAEQLNNNIPGIFNKPQVKSRIAVLNTKVRSLYTYINLDFAQDKKVVTLIGDITRETASIQNQFDEIIRFNEIPKEAGEEEMLRALDTVRMANPDAQPQIQMQPAQKTPSSTVLQRRTLKKLTPVN